jgi:hypothetical protein
MRYQGRICTKSRHFICPCTTELGAAIAAPQIANVIEIDFHIAGNNIFVSGRILNTFKRPGCPGFTGSVVPITEFALVFHVPAILTFSGTLPGQHHFPLLFFMFSIV